MDRDTADRLRYVETMLDGLDRRHPSVVDLVERARQASGEARLLAENGADRERVEDRLWTAERLVREILREVAEG